jgi:hypothetical protein
MSADIGIEELVMRLRRMMRTSSRHHVVVVRYSRFGFIRSNPRLMLVQINGVRDLAAHYEAECHVIGGTDAVVIFPRDKESAATELADRLIANIMPDRGDEDPDGGRLVASYRIPEDYGALRTCVAELQNAASDPSAPPPAAETPAPVLDGPLTPALVATLQELLDGVRADKRLCRQNVFRFADARWQRDHTHFGIDLGGLHRDLFPKVDLHGPYFLGNALREHLDQPLINALAASRATLAGSRIGVRLGVTTVLGPLYREFARVMAEARVASVTVELDARALLADLPAAGRAVTAVRAAGHGFGIGGISLDLLPYLRIEAFAADTYRIVATRDQLGLLGTPAVVAVLRRIGKRVILCGCDHDDSLSIGRALGIERFQGDRIDGLADAA